MTADLQRLADAINAMWPEVYKTPAVTVDELVRRCQNVANERQIAADNFRVTNDAYVAAEARAAAMQGEREAQPDAGEPFVYVCPQCGTQKEFHAALPSPDQRPDELVLLGPQPLVIEDDSADDFNRLPTRDQRPERRVAQQDIWWIEEGIHSIDDRRKPTERAAQQDGPYAAGSVPYPPDCADCPSKEECRAKNDCQVLRQIRHGRSAVAARPQDEKKWQWKHDPEGSYTVAPQEAAPQARTELAKAILDYRASPEGIAERAASPAGQWVSEHERNVMVQAAARALCIRAYPGRSLDEALSPNTDLWQRLLPEAELAVDAALNSLAMLRASPKPRKP